MLQQSLWLKVTIFWNALVVRGMSKKIDDQNSLLIFTYNFELKGGLLGQLLLPLISYLFSKDMEKRLIAIKNYINKDYKKPPVITEGGF